ncbi:MFS transporter [Lysinibacillus sp. KCTC 33748]|uniref:MFS transporter n=1 Tax=unclassified Lysinibacillus TaxID=2636778 RepID=UPI0009A8A269|nr:MULTISPECIES: MFS transporter [unclassified Lysinibacillus]OXS73992.1 MFS transporter [Lysinibacillus sp. KCTC 33748]SKB68704.1 Predicted arabinose efflux permease, MFS family [Lysinibacillus sp. AC-3]
MTKQQKFLTLNLFLLTFVLGTSEFVIVGLLSEVSTDLKISISTAGALVSTFAISFAIGTPILTAISSRFSKYPLMLTLIVLFIAGNILSALSATYGLLIISRILTAVVTGVLIALAMAVASEVMPTEKRGPVISIIFTGFTIASVIGVPIGTFIGQLGGWRITFWFTALLGIISLIASSTTVPKGLTGAKSSLKKQIGLLINLRIIIAFFIPALSIGATYTVYTYLTPLLLDVLVVPGRYISLVFLLYGVVSIFSTIIGGKLVTRNGIGKLRYIFLIQAMILGLFYFSSNSIVLGLLNISFIALIVYTMNSTMQLYFIDLADKHYPAARDLASSLTPVSVNVGIALGSALGGFVTTNMKLIDVSWLGGIVAIFASLLTFISYHLDQKTSFQTKGNV